MFGRSIKRIGGRWLAVTAGTVIGLTLATGAQAQSNVCSVLNAKLVSLQIKEDRNAGNPRKFEQFDEAVVQQKRELRRAKRRAERRSCVQGTRRYERYGNSEQCIALRASIRKMRANINKLTKQRDRYAGRAQTHRGERRRIEDALYSNGCQDQYNLSTASSKRSLLDLLFGDDRRRSRNFHRRNFNYGNTYRTMCVRKCDGYYFPISFSTIEMNFGADQIACEAQCPSADVELFYHVNPGQLVEEMVALDGTPYKELPNAFSYRKELDKSCTCQAAQPKPAQYAGGQSKPGTAPYFNPIDPRSEGVLAQSDLGARTPQNVRRGPIPLPLKKPDPNLDPETGRNMAGSLELKLTQAGGEVAEMASARNMKFGDRTVRLVGPKFFDIQ